jgi:hypothetical protein
MTAGLSSAGVVPWPSREAADHHAPRWHAVRWQVFGLAGLDTGVSAYWPSLPGPAGPVLS